MHKAIHSSDGAIMRFLLTLEPDINLRSTGEYYEMTPLHWGVYRIMGGGFEHCLQMLLDAGADLTLKTIDPQTREEEFTALELAERRTNQHLIPLLTLYPIVKPYVPTADEALLNDIQSKFLVQLQTNPPTDLIEAQITLLDCIVKNTKQFCQEACIKNKAEIVEKGKGLDLRDYKGRENWEIAHTILHRSLYNTIFNTLYPKLYPSIQKAIDEHRNPAASLAKRLDQTELELSQSSFGVVCSGWDEAESSVPVLSFSSASTLASSSAATAVDALGTPQSAREPAADIEPAAPNTGSSGRFNEHFGVEIPHANLDSSASVRMSDRISN